MGSRLNYVPGSSDPIDGAVDTLLAGAGVCRDFAHLVVALLRAVNVPARVVSAYAPGLDPMDFHAVAEAFVDTIVEAFKKHAARWLTGEEPFEAKLHPDLAYGEFDQLMRLEEWQGRN